MKLYKHNPKFCSGTLEILMVMKPSADYEQVSFQLPKLNHLYMMECKNSAAIEHMRTKCPSSCAFVTGHKEAYDLMMEHAKTYPFPEIAWKFEEFDCMMRVEYYEVDDDSSDYDDEYLSEDFVPDD